ncbi:MAG TPA: MBL fold metallo-hydrolase [Thermodesulfobacteriota bacterium]|nr:MBL fold metallo-hydrolase [Thermodesulfobacteriota bacterium]
MMKTQEIGPLKIFFGRHPTYPYCNTLLIRGERSLLVDPSCHRDTLFDIAQKEKIDLLFNTHYHPDHIRYNFLFPAAEFLVHRLDAPCFRSLDSMAEWVGINGTPYEAAWRLSLQNDFAYRERQDIGEIEDGTLLDLGGATIRFLHFPGHTPGLTGFRIPECDVVFLADMELSTLGPWYHNRRASIQGIIDSVEKIRKMEARVFIPSHGPVIPGDKIGSRLDRYLGNILARETKILEALASPKTLDDLACMSLISRFRISRRVIWFLFERNMLEKHLERLAAAGRVVKVGDRYARQD